MIRLLLFSLLCAVLAGSAFAQPFTSPIQAPVLSSAVVEEPDAEEEEESEPPQKQPAVKTKKTIPVKATDKKNESTEEVGLSHVVLEVLNKVTAHVQTVDAPIGSVVRSGTIEIIAHRCWKSSPDEMPENAALLEISEIKQGEAPARIFQGWMFSSTPGISALENAFYDVSVVSCEQQNKLD